MTGFLFNYPDFKSRYLLFVPMLLQGFLYFCLAEQPIILKVSKSDAPLYFYNDTESEKIGTVQAGDEVTLKIEAIGLSTWYLVETVDGRIGWLRSSDVEPPVRVEPSARGEESLFRFSPGSTWIASTARGRSLGGSWTGTVNISTGIASGSWAVIDSANRIVLQGTWSALKYDQEWRGSWRALVTGQAREYSGTWVSGLKISPNMLFTHLFEQAVGEIVKGKWESAGQSGDWAIRIIRQSDF